MKKATCKTSGFSHIFSGTQLFDGGTSSNEDQQSYQLVQISHKGLYLTSIFTRKDVLIKTLNDKSSLISVFNHQISSQDRALPASACPFLLWSACGVGGRNKATLAHHSDCFRRI
jgi:hypothetical protein